jgi:Tfp pilus assembly ATPase PilU
MQTMNQSLYKLYSNNEITLEDAMARSGDADELRTMIEQGGASRGSGGGNRGGSGGRGKRVRYT